MLTGRYEEELCKQQLSTRATGPAARAALPRRVFVYFGQSETFLIRPEVFRLPRYSHVRRCDILSPSMLADLSIFVISLRVISARSRIVELQLTAGC